MSRGAMDALLGNVQSKGVDIELQGSLNFTRGLKVTPNPEAGTNDVEFDATAPQGLPAPGANGEVLTAQDGAWTSAAASSGGSGVQSASAWITGNWNPLSGGNAPDDGHLYQIASFDSTPSMTGTTPPDGFYFDLGPSGPCMLVNDSGSTRKVRCRAVINYGAGEFRGLRAVWVDASADAPNPADEGEYAQNNFAETYFDVETNGQLIVEHTITLGASAITLCLAWLSPASSGGPQVRSMHWSFDILPAGS